MIHDEYAFRAGYQRGTSLCEEGIKHLSGGLLHGCTLLCKKFWDPFAKEKAEACYRNYASSFPLNNELPWEQLHLKPSLDKIRFKNMIGIEVDFKLESPYYSKDDRPFYVMDNPVLKDWVFGVPYICATMWKGMLRDSFRRQEWPDNNAKVKMYRHLFGNEQKEEKCFLQGALRFFPTFFQELGFEVINPHSRETKAGTMPIYYEVVPAQAPGVLRVLYTPERPKESISIDESVNLMKKLIDAISDLLQVYGISAKRTAGWGACNIQQWRIKTCDFEDIITDSANKCKENIDSVIYEIISELISGKSEKIADSSVFPGYLIV
jgi:CRISPR-associated protein Cmr2